MPDQPAATTATPPTAPEGATVQPPAAPTVSPAEPSAAELFRQALGGAPEAPAQPEAPPPVVLAPDDPAAAPAAPPVAPEPKRPERAGKPSIFAEARIREREARAERERLAQQERVLAERAQRLAQQERAIQARGQTRASDEQFQRELAEAVQRSPDTAIEMLAKRSGMTVQDVMRRIQLRATTGPEVDQVQQERAEDRRRLEELQARVDAADKAAKQQQARARHEAIASEYAAVIDEIVGVAENPHPVDAEAWPHLTAEPGELVAQDVDRILRRVYRMDPNYRPTHEDMRQIAESLNQQYDRRNQHRARVTSGRGAAKPTESLSGSSKSAPAGIVPAASGTRPPQQPASAPAGNGSRVDIAAAASGGASRRESEEQRMAEANAMFRAALHGG